MIRDDELGPGASYWPSVGDLFMSLFIVAIALIAVVLLVFLPGEPTDSPLRALERCEERNARLKYELEVCQREREAVSRETEKLADALRESQQRVADLEKELARTLSLYKDSDAAYRQCSERVDELSDYPGCKTPIITIAPGENFFASGSAEVSPDFARDLRNGGFQEIAAEIIERNQGQWSRVDTLEIIGHTDGLPFKRAGNLDRCLPQVFEGRNAIGRCKAGSNNDLGLMRALAIKDAWRSFVGEHPHRAELEPIKMRTYSAGQTVPIEPGQFKADDPRARRIEMRLTRLN